MSVSGEDQYENESFEKDSEAEIPEISATESETDEEAFDPNTKKKSALYEYTRNVFKSRSSRLRQVDTVEYGSSSDDDGDVIISKTIAEINTLPMDMDDLPTASTLRPSSAATSTGRKDSEIDTMREDAAGDVPSSSNTAYRQAMRHKKVYSYDEKKETFVKGASRRVTMHTVELNGASGDHEDYEKEEFEEEEEDDSSDSDKEEDEQEYAPDSPFNGYYEFTDVGEGSFVEPELSFMMDKLGMEELNGNHHNMEDEFSIRESDIMYTSNILGPSRGPDELCDELPPEGGISQPPQRTLARKEETASLLSKAESDSPHSSSQIDSRRSKQQSDSGRSKLDSASGRSKRNSDSARSKREPQSASIKSDRESGRSKPESTKHKSDMGGSQTDAESSRRDDSNERLRRPSTRLSEIEFDLLSHPSYSSEEYLPYHLMDFAVKSAAFNPVRSKVGNRLNMSFPNERQREIERHNRILLNKIRSQKSTLGPPKTSQNKPPQPAPKRLNSAAINRMKQQRQIDMDNVVLKRKLVAITSRHNK